MEKGQLSVVINVLDTGENKEWLEINNNIVKSTVNNFHSLL